VGRVIVNDDPEEFEIRPAPDQIPDLLYRSVPEPRTTKSQLHLELRLSTGKPKPDDLDATHADHRQDDETWVVLAHPEGNELCVLAPGRPPSSRRSRTSRPDIVAVLSGYSETRPPVNSMPLLRRVFEASDADEPVGGLDKPSDIGRCDPLPADRRQVFVGRLTGDRTRLSDVDGQVVLPRLGEQLASWWHTDADKAVAHARLEQFGCVAGEHDTDIVTDLQRPVDGEVNWNRGASRIGAAGRGHVQHPHE
jgi:Glyoxalase-like domain